jgi:hypothetical protein
MVVATILYSGVTREWLYWYDRSGKRYPMPQEKIQRLAEKLRSLGIDPDNLD